jgi:two-component system OmpR family sensor kinase
MTSFRASLALRIGVGTLLVFIAMGTVSVLALRSILSEQLDGTLLHLAEVEAQAGAATTGSDFEFHEGVLLGSSEGPATELTRYAQLWTSEGQPLVRSRNLSTHLELPENALSRAKADQVGWATHDWRGQSIRSVVYPLALVGAAHGVHLLQVAAPTAPIKQTLSRFAWLVAGLTVVAGGAAYYMGWRIAGLALRPTREITQQTEAIEAGTLSDRITAHADVEEFRRLVTVFNSMLDRLDDAFKVQRQFTADAGHELRAPLTVLRGDLDVTLKRDRTAAEYRETLERCREEVLRLSRLAEDLLVLARTDAGVLLEHRTEVDLRSLAEHAIERYRPLAAQRGITLEAVGEEAVVFADPRVLGRVIGNLIDNAVKFSPNGGTVRVEISSDDVVRLVVRDDGQGIAPEHVGHLFCRFFRADPARPRAEGTGLGLAIAQAGAQAHRGNVEFVGNSPGATFALVLPAGHQSESSQPPAAPMVQSRSEPVTR